MIVLAGVTGNTGRVIASELSSRGVVFRCMVRRREAGQQLAAQGYDVVEGDLDRPETLEGALHGATRAYLTSTPDGRLAEREIGFVDAAAAAGVSHVVKLSALGASPETDSPILKSHAAVERRLADSSLDYTVLRSTGFWQTLYAMSHELIQHQGVMAYPAGEGKVSFVDMRDVAAAACQILIDPDDHVGKTYDLTGHEAISFSGMAEVLSRALGRPVRYVPAREEDLAAALEAAGVAVAAREHVIKMFRLVREGGLALTYPGFEELGIAPAGFRDFATDLAAGMTKGAVSFKPPAQSG